MKAQLALIEIMNEARGEIWIAVRALPALGASGVWRGAAELAHWSIHDLTECRVVAFGLTAAAGRLALRDYMSSMARTRWRIIPGLK